MNIKSINFGRVMKINAPYEAAEQMANIINGQRTEDKELNRKINSLFRDKKFGCAYPYKFDDKTSYIFSGIHGKKFIESSNQMDFEIEYFTGNGSNPNQQGKNSAIRNHRLRVSDMIRLFSPGTLNVEYDSKNNVIKQVEYV